VARIDIMNLPRDFLSAAFTAVVPRQDLASHAIGCQPELTFSRRIQVSRIFALPDEYKPDYSTSRSWAQIAIDGYPLDSGDHNM